MNCAPTMNRTPPPIAAIARLLPLALTLALVACGERSAEAGAAERGSHMRCAQCGMRLDTAPQWRAGLGEDTGFDSPKCLFRWTASQGRGTETAWFTEYYSSERKPLVDLVFVVGSDVLSPMGDDLVPVEGRGSDVLSPMGDDLVPVEGRVRAELFVRDHGGRIVTPGQVDAVLLRSLDPR